MDHGVGHSEGEAAAVLDGASVFVGSFVRMTRALLGLFLVYSRGMLGMAELRAQEVMDQISTASIHQNRS